MARTNAEMTEETRTRLLDAAQDLFAHHGFGGVSADEISATVHLTRGALTYQFQNKKGLFKEVYTRLCQTVADEIIKKVEAQTCEPIDRLLIGCDMMLDIAHTPSIRRIIMEDGPSVLGTDQCREIMSRIGIETLARPFQLLVNAGRFDAGDIVPVSQLIFGALNQASMDVAMATDPENVKKRYAQLIRRFLIGFMRSV